MLTQAKMETLEESKTFGRFVVEPLEPGYGQTIGNSLRRVLLGDLPGVAITHIKIGGVSHQFSTIPGVSEDVTEIVLNLKKIRIKIEGKEKVKLQLSAKGKGDVKAGDIKTEAGVEIVNPQLHIAHLTSPKAKLSLDMTAARGIGYIRADEQKTNEIGVIAVDSLFSPVTRVNYEIDATRVGRRTDFDKLTLEVTTDGTIKPREAIKIAARILTEHFRFFYESRKVAKQEESFPVETISEEIKKVSLEELDLPTRITNALKAAKIENIGDLLEKNRKELLRVKNLGAKSLAEVEKKLKEKGVEIAA